jgi:hypothetical protein
MEYAAREMIRLHNAGKIPKKVAEDVLLTELKTVEHRVSEYRKDWNDLAHTINRMGRKYPANWKNHSRPDLREDAGKPIHEETPGEAGYRWFLEEITWRGGESDEFIDREIARLERLREKKGSLT